MATRRNSTTRKTNTKRNQMRTKPRNKKALAGAAFRKKKAAAKKRTIKRTARKRASKRTQVRQPSQDAAPVVQDTIIDIVDEPLPGVVRITEIEEVSAALPESEENED
jgi:hypothetical protein